MNNISFQKIEWSSIEKIAYQGESGVAFWQTIDFGGLRIRLVEYAPGYVADHWCQKGHVVHCLEGEFTTELSTGETFVLKKDDSFVVSDDLSSHRSHSANGVKLLIVDGDFLNLKSDR